MDQEFKEAFLKIYSVEMFFHRGCENFPLVCDNQLWIVVLLHRVVQTKEPPVLERGESVKSIPDHFVKYRNIC